MRDRAGSAAEQQAEVAAHIVDALAEAIEHGAGGLRERDQWPTAADNLERAAAEAQSLAVRLRALDGRAAIEAVEQWAKRHPGWFLGGAFAAGFVLARFIKSTSSRRHDRRSGHGVARNWGRPASEAGNGARHRGGRGKPSRQSVYGGRIAPASSAPGLTEPRGHAVDFDQTNTWDRESEES